MLKSNTKRNCKIESILYVLPQYDYFFKGRMGHVAHALGVIEGLIKNNSRVYIVSGPKMNECIKSHFDSKMISKIHMTEIDFKGLKRINLLTKLCWIFKLRKRIKKIAKENLDIKHIIIRYAVSNAFILLNVIRKLIKHEIKSGFEVNSLAYNRNSKFVKPLERVIYLLEYYTLHRAHFIYTISNKLKNILSRKEADNDKIVVVPNGGPVIKKRPWLDLTFDPKIIRFVYLGVYYKYYEVDLLINVFKELSNIDFKNIELHLYGDGERLTHLHYCADGCSNIFFHGRYKYNELFQGKMLDRNTIVVLPYSGRGEEDFTSPIKLYEYIALGLPIVASRVGQIKDALKDNLTAKLYNPGDFNSLKDAVLWMATNDSEREKMKNNLLSIPVNEYSWQGRMSDLIQYLKSS